MVYKEGELDSGGCAPDPKWAASQLRAYGVDVVMKSEKLHGSGNSLPDRGFLLGKPSRAGLFQRWCIAKGIFD